MALSRPVSWRNLAESFPKSLWGPMSSCSSSSRRCRSWGFPKVCLPPGHLPAGTLASGTLSCGVLIGTLPCWALPCGVRYSAGVFPARHYPVGHCSAGAFSPWGVILQGHFLSGIVLQGISLSGEFCRAFPCGISFCGIHHRGLTPGAFTAGVFQLSSRPAHLRGIRPPYLAGERPLLSSCAMPLCGIPRVNLIFCLGCIPLLFCMLEQVGMEESGPRLRYLPKQGSQSRHPVFSAVCLGIRIQMAWRFWFGYSYPAA